MIDTCGGNFGPVFGLGQNECTLNRGLRVEGQAFCCPFRLQAMLLHRRFDIGYESRGVITDALVAADTMDKETRGRAKAVNFGIVYGISAFGLAAQLGIPQSEAKAYIERYFERYAGVRTFIEKTLDQTLREGSVRTMFGRVRPIPDIESRNPNQRGFAERTAINTPLQGTAADLIKLAMIAIDRKLTERALKTRMVLQVHDELLFEVPTNESAEIEALVRTEMEGVVKLSVPLVASLGFGANWRDL